MDPAEPGRRSLLVAGCWGLIAGGWLLGTGRSRSAPRENPIACELNDAIGRSLGEGERDRTGLAADAVVVDVEAAAQTEARVENERADECAGAVPRVTQDRRERRHVRSHSRRAVVVNAVRRGHESGQDRGMSRQRQRNVGMRARETDTAGREAVERRRQRAASVGADAIGAQRIDGDEQHVRSRERARSKPFVRPRSVSAVASDRQSDDERCGAATPPRASSPPRRTRR